MAHQIRYIMVGGFLGAGKTTTLGRLARHYTDQGLNVGIVTNDQATDLVDTNTLRSQGFDVGEVAGACFCCNFDELMGTIEQLGEANKPDVLLAEPVGSCTDLVATVIQPIKRLFEADFTIAPYTVILKPSHGRRILKNEKGTGFSPKAAYILKKQLEEADAILINRIDELEPAAIEELSELLREHHPDTPVLRVSAKSGEGFDGLTALLEQQGDFGRKVLDIDYDIYAEGEAELGWLNSSIRVTAEDAFPLDTLLLDVVTRLRDLLGEAEAEAAHLKTIGLWEGFFGVANLISSETEPELSLPSHCDVKEIDLIVNARVACDPQLLETYVTSAVDAACAAIGASADYRQTQSFRPGRPVPTHRYDASGVKAFAGDIAGVGGPFDAEQILRDHPDVAGAFGDPEDFFLGAEIAFQSSSFPEKRALRTGPPGAAVRRIRPTHAPRASERCCIWSSDAMRRRLPKPPGSPVNDPHTATGPHNRIPRPARRHLKRRETMRGKQNIVDALNDGLTIELTAINQYFVQAKMCKNWGLHRLGDKHYHESIGEMKHAEKLIDRIIFLDGVPEIARYDTIRVGTSVKEQFENDLVLEQKGVDTYNAAIALCIQENDAGSRDLMEGILVDSEEHVDWLESQLDLIDKQSLLEMRISPLVKRHHPFHVLNRIRKSVKRTTAQLDLPAPFAFTNDPATRDLSSAHLVGIGGSGMKALAELLDGLGWKVTGSELDPTSPVAQSLRYRGFEVHAGHADEFVPADTEVLIYSSAIDRSNPERRAAARMGISQWSYSEMLGRLMRDRLGVSIAGTHGKSTTTAMIAWILRSAERSPSVVCGAGLCDNGRSGFAGESDLFVVESCEYQRNFLNLHPRHAVILGIEPDHFDCFLDLDETVSAFAAFAAGLDPAGTLLLNADCPNCEVLHLATQAAVETYSMNPGADWWAADLRAVSGGTRFRVMYGEQFLTEITLPVPGRHNVQNALAAVAMCHSLEVPTGAIRDAMHNFPGIQRRYERKGFWRGVTLIDDYAHHPTAVAATLAALRHEFPRRRIWCAFQPHQILRTERLMDEFSRSFTSVDEVLTAPIYAAREATPGAGGTTSVDGTTVRAGGAAPLSQLISVSVKAELAGLETLAGIPGTVGGALHGNAGTKSGDVSQFVQSVKVLTGKGEQFTRSEDELTFGYRTSSINELVVLQAEFELQKDDPAEITRRMRKLWILKKATQPLSFQSAGCIFKNPRGMSAGAVIEQCGLKGTRIGGAEISDRHANFIITHDGVTSDDVLKLIDTARAKVEEQFGVDPAGTDLARYDWSGCDAVFIALHGSFGEDGRVQQLLEQAGVVYTGSDPHTSQTAFSKSATKERFALSGVPTLPYALIHENDDAGRIQRQAQSIGFPCVLKPDAQGSSFGVSIVRSPDELPAALTNCFQYDAFGILEPYVDGTEWTVGMLDDVALPPIRIETDRTFFDFTAKYKEATTQYLFEFDLPTRVVAAIKTAGRRACEAIGTRGPVRADIMLDRFRQPWVLEVNTIPGLTSHSLLPKAAAEAGIAFEELCESTIAGALASARQNQASPAA
eukprot:g5269.t1